MHRCIFVHIPKCAGTSIEDSLGLKFVRARMLPLMEGHWHCSKQQTIKKLGQKNWDSYFKFSFVRNPWDRVISAWRMFETMDWCRLDRSYSLTEFIDVVLDENINYKASYRTTWEKKRWERTLQNVRHHTLPATHPYYGLVENNSFNVDFCGRFENLLLDFQKVTQQLNANIELPHKLKTNRSSGYKTYFTDLGLIRVLREYYEKDCEFFEYDF